MPCRGGAVSGVVGELPRRFSGGLGSSVPSRGCVTTAGGLMVGLVVARLGPVEHAVPAGVNGRRVGGGAHHSKLSELVAARLGSGLRLVQVEEGDERSRFVHRIAMVAVRDGSSR